MAPISRCPSLPILSARPRSRQSGFTLIELLVVISIIALLLGILVPVLGEAKKTAQVMKEGVSLRNVHAALAMYGTSNKDWFPGFTAKGKIAGVAGTATADFIGKYYAAATNAVSTTTATTATANTAAYAQAVLMDEGGANPLQWLSPGETHVTGGNAAVPHASGSVLAVAATKGSVAATSAATEVSITGMVSVFNNSFAVLAYGSGVLNPEWRSNQNAQTVVLATRMIGGSDAAFDTSASNSFNSVWTAANSGVFKGSFVHGDSSTGQETFKRADTELPFGSLKYGLVVGTPATAGADVAGPFGHVTVVTGAGTYGTSAGNLGATLSSSVFVTGQLASGLN